MLVLRYLYVLALVVWLGGMVLLGAVIAPATFQVLQAIEPVSGRELAGTLFGTIIARFHYVAYGCGLLLFLTFGAIAVLGPRPRHFLVRSLIIAGMLGVAFYSGFVVLARIDALQAEVGALVSRLAAADPRRIEFDALHALSTRLMMLNIAAALVLLYWEARE